MTTFVNTTEPQLRILIPETGEYVSFDRGKLELADDDPRHAAVMAVAARRPSISIHVNATTCPECGQVFTGGVARAELGKHRKAVHFDRWLADKTASQAREVQREVKARAGYVCDQCAPVQEYPDPEALAVHVAAIHTQPPAMDDEGNEIGGGDPDAGRQVVVPAIPAATPTGS